MTNILSDDKRREVLALGRLGWTLRRIQQATGVRRETASAYLRAAGLAVRPPGRWGHAAAKPAIEVSTDSGALLPGIASPPSQTPPPGRTHGQRVRPLSRVARPVKTRKTRPA
jgi:hypothetical protein